MKILRGHALDLLSQTNIMPDLVVTDPPYAFGGSGAEHELSATVATVVRESAIRLKSGCWMLVFCASSWRSISYMVESVRGVLIPVRIGSWLKPNPKTKARIPGWAWSSVSVIAFKKGQKATGNPSPTLDHIVCDTVKGQRRAQLPREVCDWAIQPYATKGVFLDPFAGSGALVESAERFGMESVGFEIKES